MANFYRITMQYFNSAAGTTAQNVVCMEDASGTKTPEQIKDIMNLQWWGNATADALRFFSNTSTTLRKIFVQRVGTEFPEMVHEFVVTPTAGFNSDAILYPTIGLIFKLSDGFGGVRHRGRVYAPWCGNNLLGPAGVTSTATTRFNQVGGLRDVWLNRFGPLPVADLFWNIRHRGQIGAAEFTRVTNITMSGIGGNQRRRNIGIGL